MPFQCTIVCSETNELTRTCAYLDLVRHVIARMFTVLVTTILTNQAPNGVAHTRGDVVGDGAWRSRARPR